MTPWSAFFDLLATEVPGCPQEAQTNALRQSAITFCECSMVWEYDHPDVPIVNGTARYLFDPPDDAVVHLVTHAEFNERELEVNVMEHDIRIWNWRNKTGFPEYVLGGPLAFTLAPKPDIDGTLTLDVILKPSHIATGIEDFIFNEYAEPIVHGAKARLMRSPKKPYTDMGLSTYYESMFRIETARAGLRASRDHSRAPVETRLMKRR